MDPVVKTALKPHKPKRELFDFAAIDVKKRQPRLPLFFPPDVEPLLTPFRVKALENIYEITHRELGGRIKSTVVAARAGDDEPGRTTLVLAIWADLDSDQWSRADRAISNAVFDAETSWSDAERADYVDMIHFEILPLNV